MQDGQPKLASSDRSLDASDRGDPLKKACCGTKSGSKAYPALVLAPSLRSATLRLQPFKNDADDMHF